MYKSKSYEFRLWGRHALFTDPVTRVGGEKCSYHIPTYEALKGVAKSIYWKPTIVWVIDKVRVMKTIQTQTKGTKPLIYGGGNTLAIYTFLTDVEYQVSAHFEWNMYRPELAEDRNAQKHEAMADRALVRGGRQDIFLGTRDCQGYVEPCTFGEGDSAYQNTAMLHFGLMFHGFDYPDEVGGDQLQARFWQPCMQQGVIEFIAPQACQITKTVREMTVKPFNLQRNIQSVTQGETAT